MTTELIPAEIHDTANAIRTTLAETRPDAAAAAALMHARGVRRIYLIGNGTSLYSSMAATYTARLLAGPDSPLVIAMPAGDFRHFTPALNEQDAIVGVSASGEFKDVLAVFERLQGKCLRIGITHIPGSSITHTSDALIYSKGGPSNVPVMTKTYASTLTAAHLLLLEFFGADASYYVDLGAAADRTAAAVEIAEERVPGIVKELMKYEHAFYFGAGNAFPAALESALKMKEMALLHAEGAETWEMATGPATLVGPGAFCAAMYAGQDLDIDTLSQAKLYREWGARLIEIGPSSAPVGDWHLPVEAARYGAFASLSLVPPAALLAYRMAKARGHTPERPAWRERYYAQGFKHILGV
jgi:glucosamine--fructose-6-phosphate aminotransferase (isomerizing)